MTARKRYWHLCPFHGVEECTWLLEPRYRRKPGEEAYLGPDRGERSHCWTEGYGPRGLGPHPPTAHFCWTPGPDHPGWFTGLLYHTEEQAASDLRRRDLPVKVCPCCDQVTEDARSDGFDGVDALSDGVVIPFARGAPA